jgi:hypothetical protein
VNGSFGFSTINLDIEGHRLGRIVDLVSCYLSSKPYKIVVHHFLKESGTFCQQNTVLVENREAHEK